MSFLVIKLLLMDVKKNSAKQTNGHLCRISVPNGDSVNPIQLQQKCARVELVLFCCGRKLMAKTKIPAEVIEAVQKAQHLVVFTGAGVSAESGVHTFRDALTGLWSQFDPMQLAT